MKIAWSSSLVALACIWSTAALSISPATTEQMVCGPTAFVVATVMDTSPSASLSDQCDENRYFCYFDWPLTINVDEVLATKPSTPSPQASTGLQRGTTIHVKVKTSVGHSAPGTGPDDWQGMMSTAYSPVHDATSVLREKKFIFGLFDTADYPSQMWSLSFERKLEKMLLDHAAAQDCR